MIRTRLATVTAILGALVAPAEASPKPSRIVSLNLCTDQILLDLVPRERIRALSHLATLPMDSAAVARARGITTTRGAAEEVIAFDPDLVIAGTWTTPATVDLLRRLGRRMELVPLASDLAGIAVTVRQVAAAVGESEKGEQIVAGLASRLAAPSSNAQRPGERTPSALVYQVNGLASGSNSLADAVLTAAGFSNHARTLRLGSGGHVALETLIANPPDLLVLSAHPGDYATPVADNLRHPLLERFKRKGRLVVLPWRLWLCGTPAIADAIDALRAAREQLASGGGAQ